MKKNISKTLGKRKVIKCWSCKKVLKNRDSSYNYHCPYCNAEYANKPKNEAFLSVLQDKYLTTRDEKYLNSMMVILNDITYNLICSRLKSSGKFLDEDSIMDKVQWTLLKMTYYYRKPEFKITSSFIEYIKQVILYPLYNYKQKQLDDTEISLFTPISGEDNENKTLMDKLSNMSYLDGKNDIENKLFSNIEKDNLIITVNDFIKSLVNQAYKYKDFNTALKLMVLYKHYFNKATDRFLGNWWTIEGIELKDYFEKSQTILKDVIYNNMK